MSQAGGRVLDGQLPAGFAVVDGTLLKTLDDCLAGDEVSLIDIHNLEIFIEAYVLYEHPILSHNYVCPGNDERNRGARYINEKGILKPIREDFVESVIKAYDLKKIADSESGLSVNRALGQSIIRDEIVNEIAIFGTIDP